MTRTLLLLSAFLLALPVARGQDRQAPEKKEGHALWHIPGTEFRGAKKPVAEMTPQEKEKAMQAFLADKELKCPACGVSDFTGIRQFNLMFKTFVGVTEDSASTVYLRPETAQGIFVNFKNVQTTSRRKVPFGIGQIGKSFRNEITPGNFIFRTREFEQMELEFFCHPSESGEWFGHWKNFCMDWLMALGMKQDNLRMRDHAAEELSHYSQATMDIEYRFPFGWGSCGAWRTGETSISPSTRSTPGRSSPMWTRRPRKSTCLM